MKFTLNENEKFILDERLILTEADDKLNATLETVLKTITDNMKAQIVAMDDSDGDKQNFSKITNEYVSLFNDYLSKAEQWDDEKVNAVIKLIENNDTLHGSDFSSQTLKNELEKLKYEVSKIVDSEEQTDENPAKDKDENADAENNGQAKEWTKEDVFKDWDAYLIDIYGEKNLTNVKALVAILKAEIDHFGPNEKTNPFITFLKRMINNGVIFTAHTYGAVHNAYLNGAVTYKALTGKEDNKLLNNKQLYSHSGKDIEEYFSLSKLLSKWLKDDELFENGKLASLEELRAKREEKTGHALREISKDDIARLTNKDNFKDVMMYIITKYAEQDEVDKLLQNDKYNLKDTVLSPTEISTFNKILNGVEISNPTSVIDSINNTYNSSNNKQ